MTASFDGIAPTPADSGGDLQPGAVRRLPGLSVRDQSLLAVENLVVRRRIGELPSHLRQALENGVLRDELFEAIARGVFSRRSPGEPAGDAAPRRAPLEPCHPGRGSLSSAGGGRSGS